MDVTIFEVLKIVGRKTDIIVGVIFRALQVSGFKHERQSFVDLDAVDNRSSFDMGLLIIIVVVIGGLIIVV